MPVVSPIQIQERLEGIDYPATRQDLIDHVEMNNENDDMVMNVLTQIPDKEYNSPTDVSEEVSKIE
ncbi:MAG: DUF2795 domain-containing protein [Balneolaceae bacterium]